MEPGDSWWNAPYLPRTEKIHGNVRIPGSKSLTARWLVLAAIGLNPVRLAGALDSEDTRAMGNALVALGAGIEWHKNWCHVTPIPRDTNGVITVRGGAYINAGQAGTVMRFILPLAAMAHGDVTVTCADNARHRPIAGLLSALTQLGVNYTCARDVAEGTGGGFPLTIHGRGPLRGGEVSVDAAASSQFVSALLLAGPLMERGITVRNCADTLPSTPHISMTIDTLRKAGINAAGTGETWHVPHGSPNRKHITIEPDLSNAGPFLAAALVTGGRVRIENWPKKSQQPGMAYLDIFRNAGATFTWETNGPLTHLICQGHRTIWAMYKDMGDLGELVPTVAAVLAFSDGVSGLSNIGHLRGHETDRIAALTETLSAIGTQPEYDPHSETLWLRRFDARYTPTDIDSHADHRIATFGAILGLRIKGLRVANMEATAKTFPTFIELWERLVADSRSYWARKRKENT